MTIPLLLRQLVATDDQATVPLHEVLQRCSMSSLPCISKNTLPLKTLPTRPQTTNERFKSQRKAPSKEQLLKGQKQAAKRAQDKRRTEEPVPSTPQERKMKASAMRKEQRKADQIAKTRRRSEIYALNALMRSQFEAKQQWSMQTR